MLRDLVPFPMGCRPSSSNIYRCSRYVITLQAVPTTHIDIDPLIQS
jgi:hypothetical protein